MTSSNVINSNVADTCATEHRKSQPKTNAAPFDSSVVIAAEIAFAALLLYLTNHPLELDDLATAQAANPGNITVESGILTTASGNVAVSSPVIETGVLASDFTTLPAEIAVVATSVESSTLEAGINN